MTEILNQIMTQFDLQLQVAFIAICAFMLLFVFYLPLRQFQRQRKMSTLRRKSIEFEPVPPGQHLTSRFLSAMQSRPGASAILVLLVLLGTAICALIGWRIPQEIERIFGDGGTFSLIFSDSEVPALGRLAQVIGAATFGACALRTLRFLVPVMILALVTLLVVLSVQYVTGLPILSAMTI